MKCGSAENFMESIYLNLRNRLPAVRGANVLFVDDNEDLRGIVARYLTRRGYQVSVAASAMEALELLDETRVDLIVIDVVMPEMDGLELLELIKERHPNLPAVLYAGCALDEELLQKARRKRAHGLLSKDMPLSQLLMEIHRLLDYQREVLPAASLAVSE